MIDSDLINSPLLERKNTPVSCFEKNKRRTQGGKFFQATSAMQQLPLSSPSLSVDDGLAFILSHFQDPIWPRTISTKATGARQVVVYNKDQALAYFKAANYLDCRIAAYPSYTGYKGINRQAPNFIFIDMDPDRFKSVEALDKALADTLAKVKETFGPQASATVLYSGSGGYHIYIPIDAIVLEQEEIFSKFDQPSQKFLRFAEWFLSNGKCDVSHNKTVAFKNCMLRVPGSYNSKTGNQVSIISQWNAQEERPAINWLLSDLYVWLADQKIKELLHPQENPRRYYYRQRRYQ